MCGVDACLWHTTPCFPSSFDTYTVDCETPFTLLYQSKHIIHTRQDRTWLDLIWPFHFKVVDIEITSIKIERETRLLISQMEYCKPPFIRPRNGEWERKWKCVLAWRSISTQTTFGWIALINILYSNIRLVGFPFPLDESIEVCDCGCDSNTILISIAFSHSCSLSSLSC